MTRESWDLMYISPFVGTNYLSVELRYWNGNDLWAIQHFSSLDIIEKEMTRYWRVSYYNPCVNELLILKQGSSYGWEARPYLRWLLKLRELVLQRDLDIDYLHRAEEVMIAESMLWVRACC